MKGIRRIWAGLLLGWACCTPGWAMDFGRMTDQELADLRGAIQNAPQEEQNAFRQEWEKRQAVMTEEERKLYAKPPESSAQGEKLPVPIIPGRGYDAQGAGGVIFGGGEGVPGQGGKQGVGN